MSAPPNTPDTATLADLLARATPGPWHAGRSDMMSYDASGTVAFKNVYADDERGGVHLGDPMPLTVAKAVDESALYDGAGAKAIPDAEIMTNAALIALAPALAAEVLALREERERLRGALDESAAWYDALQAINELPERGGCDDETSAVDLWMKMRAIARAALSGEPQP